MARNQFWRSVHPVFIFVLSLFLIKEIFLASLIPIFQGTDEPVHLITILSQDKPLNETTIKNAAQEITRSGFWEIISQRTNTQNFEERQAEPEKYTDVNDVSASNTPASFYYTIASLAGKFTHNQDTQTRLFSIRMLSILFGAFVVFFSYHISKSLGFSEKISILLATILAFQPMFSFMATIVNIDIGLYFAFSIYTYACVSLIQNGLNRRNVTISLFGAFLGMAAKGPGLILIIMLYPLFGYLIYKKSSISPKKALAYFGALPILVLAAAIFVMPQTYFIKITKSGSPSHFETSLESIGNYLEKTIRAGEFHDSSLSYWGNFGWLDTPIPGWILSTINWIEVVGFVAVLVYLLTPILKKKNRIPAFAGMTMKMDDKAGWVPERKYLVFFLGMILALQFAIRFYDWRVFDTEGKVLIGQPGRYFLPNLVGHLVIVSVGIGLAVSWTRQSVIPYLSILRKISWIPAYAGIKKEARSLDCARDNRMEAGSDSEKDFEMVMKVLALGMILLQLHAIVNVIVPRYYL